MIEYWLIVTLLVEGHDSIKLEDVKQPDLITCVNEAMKRLQFNQNHEIAVDKYYNAKREAYEYHVGCSILKPEQDPL